MSSVRSVALGFWIGSGSRGESTSEAGLSHLIEHLLFKGSEHYSSLEIDQLFDGLGADINAGTSKEATSVYARVIEEHLPEAFAAVADMVLHPRMEEIDAEREVILEEIAMYEDDPQEKIFDIFGEAVYGDHPLGRAIIGSADVVAQTSAATIRNYHARHYVPDAIVIAAAGAIEHDRIVELAAGCRPREAGEVPPVPPALTTISRSVVRFEEKETEQYHVVLGGHGLSLHDDRRFALRVLDTILGGSTSSRLFQAVREQHGLAYAVYSFASSYSDCGQSGVYVGTRGENLARALAVIDAEIGRIRSDCVEPGELARAKENIKGRMALSMESTGSRMNRIGAETLAGIPLLGFDENVARVEAVTAEDVQELATALWEPQGISVVGIGPDPDRFAGAVEQLRSGVN